MAFENAIITKRDGSELIENFTQTPSVDLDAE